MESGNLKELQQHWNSMQKMMTTIYSAIQAEVDEDDKKLVQSPNVSAIWARRKPKTERLKKNLQENWRENVGTLYEYFMSATKMLLIEAR